MSYSSEKERSWIAQTWKIVKSITYFLSCDNSGLREQTALQRESFFLNLYFPFQYEYDISCILLHVNWYITE